MEVSYAPVFLRKLADLLPSLREEAVEKIELFQNVRNRRMLKVHKLSGRMQGFYSFSVNYKYRIAFEYVGKPRRAYLVAIDDHDIYR